MGKYNDWTRGEDEAILNIIGGVDVARSVLRGERKLVVEDAVQKPEPQQPLLTLVGTVAVQLPTRFVVDDFYKVNTKKNALVKISWLGDNFKKWFSGKVEEWPNASEIASGAGPYRTPGKNGDADDILRYHTLNRRSVDGTIIKELGGDTKAETTLAHIAGLMSKQGNGEQGALLVNGYANIFYVRDDNGVLPALNVSWDGRGWDVYADSVENPDGWHAGCRVFSHDS